jgi:PAS domain S-box-containing protein
MLTKQDIATTDPAELRRRAEERLRAEDLPLPGGDPHRLVHELQVHQIQLEMQNEAMRAARGQLETLLENYTDLYDFAPVGYFSLDAEARIRKVNLTGATMLGIERSSLLTRTFSGFVARANREAFDAFLRKVCAGDGDDKQVCEVALDHRADGPMWVDLQGTRAAPATGTEPLCRIVASDITELKRAAEAQSRTEALKKVNEALEEEVARRKETEKSLRHSQRRQSRLLEESRSMEEQLRLLSYQVLHVQEEERKRISLDLHDEISQTLVAINVHLGSLTHETCTEKERMQEKIIETQKLVEQSVESVHRFAMGLRPTVLDDFGLAPALRACTRDFTEQTNLPVVLVMPSELKPLGEDPAVALFRVAQAALSNIARHAEATEVRLTLRQTKRTLVLEIADNGKGFDVKTAHSGAKANRLGLIGMRERAEMIGGRFGITSTPGKGTTVSVRLPLSKACPPPPPSTTKESP